MVLRGSPGASIGWVGIVANSVTLPSYDGLKGTGMVIVVMPSLRIVLSLNQMSDNLIILIVCVRVCVFVCVCVCVCVCCVHTLAHVRVDEF